MRLYGSRAIFSTCTIEDVSQIAKKISRITEGIVIAKCTKEESHDVRYESYY